MSFVAYDPLLGAVKLTDVDLVAPGVVNNVAGTGSGRMTFSGEILRGYDYALGGGEFMFALAGGTIAAGAVVQFNQSLVSGAIVNTAAAWAGTADAGDMIGVAVGPMTVGQWGWFQIQGNAIANVSGAPAAGNPVYWQAAGVVSPTSVAGKQVDGAKFATAVSVAIGTGSSKIVLPSTQAVITINRPSTQSAIT